MSKMRNAIQNLGKASGGRKWVLIWESTHPEAANKKLNFAHQNASESDLVEMLHMALAADEGGSSEEN